MKLKTFTLTIFFSTFLLIFSPDVLRAQCTPATAEECPDPENNGEICPDTLMTGVLNQSYEQVVSILPPPAVGDSMNIILDHLQLTDVGNLPPGISWVSNQPDNNFPAGEYSCISLSGVPTEAGIYYLRIVVDVWVIIINGYPPINLGQQVDSTSIFLEVIDDSGIPEYANRNFFIRNNQPNPFSGSTLINFYTHEPTSVELTIFSSMGEVVYRQNYLSIRGDNKLKFDGSTLRNGTYFYVLKSSKYKASGMMVKSD